MTEKELKAGRDKIAQLEQVVADQEVLIQSLTGTVEEHTKLAEQAAEALGNMGEDDLAKKTGDKVEKTVDEAVGDTPSEVSDETKEAIVDAVGQIDPELASELTNQFAKADMADEVVDGEKLGRAVLKIFDKMALSNRGFKGGKTVVKKDKVASKNTGGSYAARVRDEIQARYNS